MKLRHIMALGFGLAIASLPAYAFQEQSGAAPAAAQEGKPEPGAAQPAADLSTPAPAKAAEGTEVTIPGFGKLGVLPKMDFGLELLYGAEGGKAPGAEKTETPEDGDLAIRGSVKHKF